MDIFRALFVPKLVFALGVLNVVSILAIFLSCRCIPSSRLGRWLMKHNWYKRFFAYHCYIWYVFWASVIIHMVFAVGLMGVPF